MKRLVVQCFTCHAISVMYTTEVDFDYERESEQLITSGTCPVCDQRVLFQLVQSIPERTYEHV